jgi:AcrR family transcriptional regulator
LTYNFSSAILHNRVILFKEYYLPNKKELIRERHKDKTKLLILRSGKNEFLSMGFQKASLRVIAKNAGVTTGAVYTHFKDKSHLFETLVFPVTEELVSMFTEAQDEHFELIGKSEKQKSLELSTEKLRFFMNYIYAHFDEFRLLLVGAQGSNLQGFINNLVQLNVKRTLEYILEIQKKGV